MNIRYLALSIAVATAAAIALPAAGYAQESSSTVTRAPVRAELVQLESVGYRAGPRERTVRLALRTSLIGTSHQLLFIPISRE